MGLSHIIILRQGFWLRQLLPIIALWLWSSTAWCNASIITTIAGNGSEGYSGENVAATGRIGYPSDVAVDSSGNIYIAETSSYRIRKINVQTGIINTVAGNGETGYSGDGGSATSAMLRWPQGIALDSSDNLYIADNVNNRIRKVNAATGIINTIAGNGTAGYSGDGGSATNAQLNAPNGIALDSAGNLYIADTSNHRIRKVTIATGKISTVAGSNSTAGYSGDGGIATSAKLNNPYDVAVDNSGNLYIADTSNHRIRKIAASTGIINTVAGNGTSGQSGDGAAATNAQATNAQATTPNSITLDSNSDFYFCSGDRIRKVNATTGNISTVAGGGSGGTHGQGIGDGGSAIGATLSPRGITLERLNTGINLYIADGHRIRRVVLTQGFNQPNLTVDPLLMPLDKNNPQTLMFTVKNAADSAAAITLGTPNLSGYYAGQFSLNTVASNDCNNATLNAGSSCTVSVSYTPDPNQTIFHNMAILSVPDTRGLTHAQALISSGEDAAGEAARRLPDVPTNVTVPAMTVGNSATITWTMTGYQTDAHSQIALFECATDGTGNAISTCGDSYASRTVASEVLAPTTTADGDWTYQNVRAKDRTYSYAYTPTKTGPVVLRFYQKSGIDKAAGNSGTSLLIPGGLNGSGSSFTYFDAEGRRIKTNVQ